jgi:hypothetical protein
VIGLPNRFHVRPNDQLGWCPNCREVQLGNRAIYRLAPLFGTKNWVCRNANRVKHERCKNSVWGAVMVLIDPCEHCRTDLEQMADNRDRIPRSVLDGLCNAADGRFPCPRVSAP